MGRQRKLDADPKSIPKINFVGRLQNTNGVNTDGTQSGFILTTLEKIKKQD